MGQLLVVLFGALLVTAIARKNDLLAPLLLVAVGLLVSLIPGLSEFTINPDLLLSVVLPPLLFTAALDSSLVGLKSSFRPIMQLGVVLVLVTAVSIGLLADLFIQDLPLAAALVLGAVVAPPDAVTAAAVGRRLHLPRRLMTIVTGESLINDAVALTIYRVAMATALGAATSASQSLLVFVEAVVIGVLVGLLLAWIVRVTWQRMSEHEMGGQVGTVMSLVLPFAAYLLAEELHGSGVLAVVAAGLHIGHHSPKLGAFERLEVQTIWRSVNLLLESLVFALIGLTLRTVIDDARDEGRDLLQLLGAAGLLLVAVIVIRILWLFGTTYLPGVSRLLGPIGREHRPPWRYVAVLSWTGMRGVVTLAAAGAVPLTLLDGSPFPARESIQLTAFAIVVGTLLIQGLTLPWLIHRFGLDDPREAERDAQAEVEARRAAMAAALQRLDVLLAKEHFSSEAESEKVARRLRSSIRLSGDAAIRQVGQSEAERQEGTQRRFTRLYRELIDAQRTALINQRDTGRIDEEVLRLVLHELDLEEAALTRSWRNR
ncbi:Na+/H+ antiporter [Actinoalloteichus hymeniacidonis]|uniref:Sodium/proton antiporter, CPA1 family n=1 Tax=Actinoalloteichus hymeniacidonis TaxID=340345 RepID=A0AAC9N122_9PSEU|nr:Na+/H+ antiporter [Actinoalloteichus hymeniacidonis]AOS66000.1 sodium/proton antiporter, CPA1 family [Actinoalloteichus hymeniacidonis]MBB5905898.1 CPA1 family monovalent cation:H+ antiporter [Actinoalloteichus hymeniacidonis]